ncbi:BTAD domain-containing putative transcriptional regulator [Mycolicibacterium mucogenicum]|uniref:Transcriptional regulator n=1 Tax=Mycolicibacterium mucogenicum TaxID=56689 RepID=A0A4R5WM78_MYCMU|nr:BTAD domain-containing putative transcriptional regulator [Mycolicibacterium mucogenicum]TDK92345.1 transcriptional regulator [Mycolicibacterium mucogenicum]
MAQYYLSGAVAARVDGTPAALGGPKQRCVLAVLLANHGTVVSIDRLIDAVWGDEPPPKALASVRSYVANLRRVLDPGADVGPDQTAAARRGDAQRQRLASHPHGYQLNLLGGDTIDLVSFESLVSKGRTALIRHSAGAAVEMLTEALALWHGDPFGEFAYHEFAAPEAIRFAALRTTAIEARFDAALQLGGGGELVPEIEAALAEHPLQERLWGHLMLALHRSNRTADAIQAFDRACTTLDREVGTRPGEGLQTLFEKIRDGAAELRVAPAPHVLNPDPDPAAPPPFVGRDAELGAVTAAVRRADGGAGGLTLVTGDSGIGKTTLAQAAVDRARAAGIAVAWAGHPSGVKLPLLWTWIQLLRQLGGELGTTGRKAVLREAPGVVNALVPEWHGDDDLNAGSRFAPTGFVLVERIVAALRELSTLAPMVLVIDDLQRADPASINTLVLLAEEFPRVPIQIIGNWTFFGDDRPMNRSSFERIVRSNDTVTLHLDGIDRAAAADLVDAVVGGTIPPAISAQVWEQAGGNPFYIKELARALDTDGAPQRGHPALSDAVVGVVGRRLGVLDRPCRRVLCAAAVVGPEFNVADLADIVDLSVSTVQSRLRPAYQTGLLDELPARPGAYRFSHGLVRDALIAQLATTDRTSVHAAIATTRTATLATAAYEHVIATADHAWRAGAELNPDVALGILEIAIQRALNRSAYHDVAGLAEHALQIGDRLPAKPEHLDRQATLWLHLAGAKNILEGQASESAAAAVQRAFEIGQEVKGRAFYGAIALQSMLLCAHGRIDEVEIIAIGLQDQYDKSGDPVIGLVNDFVHILLYTLRGNTDMLISTGLHMMDTFPPPETVIDPLHFFHPRVYCWMAIAEAVRGDVQAMREYHRRALHLAQSRGDVFNILAARLTYVECAAVLGVTDGIVELADQVDVEFTAAGSPQWAACARIVRVWAQVIGSGEGDAAVAFQAFDEYTCDGTTVMNTMFLCLLSDIELHQGRPDSARALVHRAGRLADATGEQAFARGIAERLAAQSVEPV